MNEVIKIVNSDGNEMEVNVIMSFEVEETGKQRKLKKCEKNEKKVLTFRSTL